ncbi:MAG: DUF4982 domain-containing protein [Muribaculaceae bacterium]|nr:DUF4982 domain-containing protein [Muribaculaceae bacterium]
MNSKFIFGSILLALTASNSFAADNTNDSHTYIIGHWNYPANSVNPINVVSDGEDVELFINDISNGFGRHESKHLFTFDNVIFQPGTLTAVSYDSQGKEVGRHSLVTSGIPAQIKLTLLDPSKTDPSENSEAAVIQCEVTDFYGKRCLNDNRTVIFEIEEPSDWVNVSSNENKVRVKQIQLHKGENRIAVKKPSNSGDIKVTAKASGLADSYITVPK